MHTSFDDIVAQYDFAFPAELIANEPVHPRDSAKLLVYNRAADQTSFSTFKNICDFLPKNAVLVFNETRVVPARIKLTKATGGIIEALYLEQHDSDISVMASGKLHEGDVLTWEDGHSFTVTKRDGKYADLKPSFPLADLFSLLDQYGHTPLPPYMKNSPLSEKERREEYQTVFAHERGSVAAPTAGLHFTEELLAHIKAHGCDIQYVTLHVNLGTFAPLTDDQLQSKTLHTEHYHIDQSTADALNTAKEKGRPIIAVGTTVVRTLESAASPVQTSRRDVSTSQRDVSTLTQLSGATSIFITEDDELQFIDHLITNFHVPKSSLLMLVSSMTGREKLLSLYQQAIDQKFRLFSFGDGMMVI